MRGGKRPGAGRKSKGNRQVKVVIDDKTLERVNDKFDGNSQSEKIRNCIKYGICNKAGLRVGTVFSGIGAFEHALERLGINHTIMFASDNGGVNIFSKKIIHNFHGIQSEFSTLRDLIDEFEAQNSQDNYIHRLNESLSQVEDEYNEIKIEILNKEYNDTICSKVNISMKNLSISDKKEILKVVGKDIEDISDNIIAMIELRKMIKKFYSKELSDELVTFNIIEKNKDFRKNLRALKEITKMLSQQHETIETLRVLDVLDGIDDYQEKKAYVDKLYKVYEKSNNVKKMYFDNYQISESDFHWNVSFIDGNQYRDQVDIYVGGSPCQSFSIVGKRGGFSDTRGTLFYEYVRVLSEVKPRFFIYENVKGVLSHDNGVTWDTMKNSFTETGYHFKYYVINAKDFGIPQNRERIFVVGFLNVEDYNNFCYPQPKELELTMSDFLEDNVDEKYYLPKKGISFVTDEKNIDKKYTQINGEVALCQKANQQFNWHGDFVESYTEEELEKMKKIDHKYFLSNKVKDYILDDAFYMNRMENELLIDLEVARPLTATMHKMHRAGVDNYISYGKKLKAENRRIRKLTPRECFRLMGFCDSFNLTVSDTQLYHQAGNSIVVDVLMEIVKEILKVY